METFLKTNALEGYWGYYDGLAYFETYIAQDRIIIYSSIVGDMASGVASDLSYKLEGDEIIEFSLDEPSEEFVSKIAFLDQDSLILIDHKKEERRMCRVFPKFKLTELVDKGKKEDWEAYDKGYFERYEKIASAHSKEGLEE